MAARLRRFSGKTLRLACGNADDDRVRHLEMEKFLSEHGVHICYLNETLLVVGQALRFFELRLPPDGYGGGTAIRVHKGIDH
jgi:hypothetical protein